MRLPAACQAAVGRVRPGNRGLRRALGARVSIAGILLVAMRWDILHRTQYHYAAPVRESFNEMRLQPLTCETQRVEDFRLKILPACRLRHYHDLYSNVVHHFEIAEPHHTLLVESISQVTTLPGSCLDPAATPWPLARIGEAAQEVRVFDFLQPSRYVELTPEVWRLALDASAGVTDTWQAAQAVMRFIHEQFRYEPRATHVHTHMREVLRDRRGVCQDFAHVMIGLCRALKIPALYVSGYLATETASATHAWVEVLIPGVGWRPLDPTHHRPADEHYVKLAVGRDYADVPPVTGHYKGTTQRQMEVTVQITAAP